MQQVMETLINIESNKVGLVVYSTEKQQIVASLDSQLIVPLASAAKVIIGYCVTKLVEQNLFQWNDMIDGCKLDPEENSHELYPHFQGRTSLSLGDLVEIMIACHDSKAANSVVEFCGGWERINEEISRNFHAITITPDPRDIKNKGKIDQVLEVLITIFIGYQTEPETWKPVINGLVRPADHLENIPKHHLNHMSGGLENVVVDIGILGEFQQQPFLYVLGANHLPNRYINSFSDKKIVKAMNLLYQEYNQTKELTT